MENILFDYLAKYLILSEEEKKAILDLDVFKTYDSGTILLKEGDLSNEGYFVIKGCIRSYYIIDGEEKTTEFYTETEVLSPLCSVNKEPSTYYVSCVEDTILIVSNTDMEPLIFEKFPRFESLCRILTEELLAKNQSAFDDFKTSSPEQRYLNLLQKKPDLIQRVPLHQLASYLGITAPSLSRIRQRLAEKKK